MINNNKNDVEIGRGGGSGSDRVLTTSSIATTGNGSNAGGSIELMSTTTTVPPSSSSLFDLTTNSNDNTVMPTSPPSEKAKVNGNGSYGKINASAYNWITSLLKEIWSSTEVIFESRLTWLLVFAPFALMGDSVFISETMAFAFSGLVLIPCAERLSFVTEQVAEHTNGTIGALLNATFGNAPEFLIAIAALRNGYYRVVQLAMLGSILSNLLLVFGLSCFIGGLKWQVQTVRTTSGNVSVQMLLLATSGSLLPAALFMSGQLIQAIPTTTTTGGDSNQYYGIVKKKQSWDYNNDIPTKEELQFSRVNASVLVILYLCFLLFQLGTHADEFSDDSSSGPRREKIRKLSARRNEFCRKVWDFIHFTKDTKTKKNNNHPAPSRSMMMTKMLAPKNKNSDREIKPLLVKSSEDEYFDNEDDDLLDGANDNNKDLISSKAIINRRRRNNSYSNQNSFASLEDNRARSIGPDEASSASSAISTSAPVINDDITNVDAAADDSFNNNMNGYHVSDDILSSNNDDNSDDIDSVNNNDLDNINSRQSQSEEQEQEQEPPPLLTLRSGIIWLLIITLCISSMSDILVESLEGFAHRLKLSGVFTSIVIIPYFSNVAEQVSAVIFAYKNEMDLCVGVTVGSAIQIACFVLPGSVLIGMMLDRSMTLFFHGYETTCLFLAVICIASVLQGGKTNWLVGLTLIGVYAILAAGFWFHEMEALSVDAEIIIKNITSAIHNANNIDAGGG